MYQLLARQLATAQMGYIIGSLAATINIAQRSDFFPGVPPREPDGNIEMFPSYNILRTFGMRYLQSWPLRVLITLADCIYIYI